MTLEEMRDEASLCFKERRDWGDNLERAIVLGHVKRPESDVAMIRSRLPHKRAIRSAFQVLIQWRDRLPAGLIEELERGQ